MRTLAVTDSEKIVTHSTSGIRWYILVYLYGLIFSLFATFVEQAVESSMPENFTLGVLSVVLFKPLLFVAIARILAKIKHEVLG